MDVLPGSVIRDNDIIISRDRRTDGDVSETRRQVENDTAKTDVCRMRLSLRQKFDTTLANELHSATDNDSQKYNTECRRKKWTAVQSVNIIYVTCCSTTVSFFIVECRCQRYDPGTIKN